MRVRVTVALTIGCSVRLRNRMSWASALDSVVLGARRVRMVLRLPVVSGA